MLYKYKQQINKLIRDTTMKDYAPFAIIVAIIILLNVFPSSRPVSTSDLSGFTIEDLEDQQLSQDMYEEDRYNRF